jgi:hypothetical protein
MRRSEQAEHERAGLPHLIRPARERRTLPNRRPSHQRTALPPAARPQEDPGAATGPRDMHAQLSPERQAGTTASADLVRGPSVRAAPVRGRP